jgi:hypothetical protein
MMGASFEAPALGEAIGTDERAARCSAAKAISASSSQQPRFLLLLETRMAVLSEGSRCEISCMVEVPRRTAANASPE